MERTPRPLGRFVAALAIAVSVLGVLTLAAVATASTDGEFTFAQAHAGDRWAYSLELGDGWTFGPNDTLRQGSPGPGYAFAWHAPVPVRLPDGQLHAAARLDVDGVVYDPPYFPGSASDDGHHWHDYVRSEWLGPDGLLAVELGGGAGAGSAGGGFSPLGVPVSESSQGVTIDAFVTDYAAEEGLCLADIPVSGRTVSLDGRVHLSRACHLGAVLGSDEDLRARAGPVETVVGVEALRFDGPGMKMWFSPAIPYPVQVQLTGAREATLRMTGFAAGTDPLLVPDELADRDSLPPLDLQAPALWGPDDAGSGFDFPMSEAFQRAREAPEFPDLREYLARNPDAFATGGHLMIEKQQYVAGPVNHTSGEARTWSLSLDSPTGCFWFSATREVARPEAVPGLGPLPVAVPGEGTQTTYSFNTHDFGCIETTYAAPKPTAPASWPTVTSALAWWEGFASPEELQQGPNGWTFRLRFDDGEWIQDMSIGQAAGRALRTTTTNSVTFTGASGAGGSLDLEDGQVGSYSRVVTEFRRDDHVAGLRAPDSVSTDGDGGDGGSIVQATPPLGQLGPVEITTIGLAAALAGLLVLAWPWLKSSAAFAGLFSRVQTADLLDHPIRKELWQRIEAQPGIHYQDLVRAVGKGKGAIEHHLRKLQEGGLVKSVAAGGYTCFFPVVFDRRLTAAAPALKSEGARAVLAAIQARPGTSARDVGIATELSPAAVNHHLQRLSGAGLVHIVRAGRSLSIMPTELANQVGAAAAAGA